MELYSLTFIVCDSVSATRALARHRSEKEGSRSNLTVMIKQKFCGLFTLIYWRQNSKHGDSKVFFHILDTKQRGRKNISVKTLTDSKLCCI